MGGCGCKKRSNTQPVGNSTVTVQLTEGTNQPQQQINIMERHVADLVNKIEQINDSLDQPDAE